MAVASAVDGASSPRAPLAVGDGADASAEVEDETSAEDLFREAGEAFSQVFPVCPPRDIFAGFWSGVQCVFSGLLIGMAAVVTQPVEGFSSGGILGLVRGLALGILSGAFLSVTGVCTGVVQALRGAVATPRAVVMASRGLRWDGDAGVWSEPTPYSLPTEANEVLSAVAEDDDDDEDPSHRRAVDTFYYDQLGLTPKASQRQIRQAYFQQSKRWHPDKTSEAKAKERFQTISEAYQVLSDPARRRQYDAQGRKGAGEGFVDARVFFKVLLGIDMLEPYIGRVRLAEMLFGSTLFRTDEDTNVGEQNGAESSCDVDRDIQDSERSERQQVRRQVRLAVSLAERLDVAESSSADGAHSAPSFQERARREAKDLVDRDLSVARLLLEIGWVYQNRAELHLARSVSIFGGFAPQALRLSLRRRSREATQQASTARLAFSSLRKLQKIADEAEELGKDEKGLPSVISSALPTFMDTFLSLAAHDVIGTLNKVIHRVLNDSSVDAASRLRRAQRLRELGEAFAGVAQAAMAGGTSSASGGGPQASAGPSCSSGGENERQRKRFEDAFFASMGTGGSGGSGKGCS